MGPVAPVLDGTVETGVLRGAVAAGLGAVGVIAVLGLGAWRWTAVTRGLLEQMFIGATAVDDMVADQDDDVIEMYLKVLCRSLYCTRRSERSDSKPTRQKSRAGGSIVPCSAAVQTESLHLGRV
mmetsp:Transcript_1116/g.2343  ORF Transcript_1116/g.2343 Transcript_1116/m.2343 type:complete len:124 (-) Transcript_1116:92-463(-)